MKSQQFKSQKKKASQIFGAEFGRHGLVKILTRICEGTTTSPMSSYKIGNKPNKKKIMRFGMTNNNLVR
jgi:hypothetical protein